MADAFLTLNDPNDRPGVRFADGITPLDAATRERHRPASHLIAIRDGLGVARCSIWSEGTPRVNDAPVGVIGHYAAIDAGAGTALLARATDELAARGRRTLVGPMDGNTWRSYRFVTERGHEPPFFLEPDQPDDWPAHFEAAGFGPLATYASALNADLGVVDPRADAAMRRFAADGIRLRPIDLNAYESELRAIHALSVEAFAQNFLYTPIGLDEFLAMYAPLRDRLRPDLISLAERDGELIGFMFGVPDLFEARRGEPIRTVLAKSMAVRPGRSGAGLGSVLMNELHQSARRAGFTRVIHALMHENNASLKISGRYGAPIRRYTLFSKVVPA